MKKVHRKAIGIPGLKRSGASRKVIANRIRKYWGRDKQQTRYERVKPQAEEKPEITIIGEEKEKWTVRLFRWIARLFKRSRK